MLHYRKNTYGRLLLISCFRWYKSISTLAPKLNCMPDMKTSGADVVASPVTPSLRYSNLAAAVGGGPSELTTGGRLIYLTDFTERGEWPDYLSKVMKLFCT